MIWVVDLVTGQSVQIVLLRSENLGYYIVVAVLHCRSFVCIDAKYMKKI